MDDDNFILELQSPGGGPNGRKQRRFPEQVAKRVSVYDDYTLEGLKTLIAAAFKAILNNRAEGGLQGWLTYISALLYALSAFSICFIMCWLDSIRNFSVFI